MDLHPSHCNHGMALRPNMIGIRLKRKENCKLFNYGMCKLSKLNFNNLKVIRIHLQFLFSLTNSIFLNAETDSMGSKLNLNFYLLKSCTYFMSLKKAAIIQLQEIRKCKKSLFLLA